MSKIEEAVRRAREQSPSADAGSTEDGADVPDAYHGRALVERPLPPDEAWGVEEGKLAQQRLIYPMMPQLGALNAFKEVRTELLKSVGDRGLTVLVTSVLPGGGGTFVAANLGIGLTFDETRTALLVDCNLPKPGLAKLFPAAEVEKGLTDYLTGANLATEDLVHRTGVPRLRLIATGERKMLSGDYLASQRMRRLLGEIRERYPDRYIVLDAPSISETADAKILAQYCDAAVLVVPYGRATRGRIGTAVKALGEEKLAGVVLNDQP